MDREQDVFEKGFEARRRLQKLLNESQEPAELLDLLRPAATRLFGNDRRWAEACKLPPDTVSRLRKRESCNLRTLASLASAVGYSLAVAPVAMGRDAPFSREREEELLDLCASGNTDAAAWLQRGDGFFMGGLAALLASARGFDRPRYLALAEELHVGITQVEVFEIWLQKSPVRPARFLPKLERWNHVAA